MAAACPWDTPGEEKQPQQFVLADASTLRSLSDVDTQEEQERWTKMQHRREKELQQQEVAEEYNAVTPEREYDDRDAPSAFSILWGSKKSKTEKPKMPKPKKSFLGKIRTTKRDEKGNEWKKIP
ncbi:uncharacterized protein KY384_001319 [Bacidia gigantensis]|uniref:uncharacterized protein n=1 Tax=Bacidia gigantensis TaxID=2732470 RepID=UPI001D0398E2|nr:uncharacterized protein KY384_001319 [Bacidia gigantensis]KAG8533579.1 hypothetical protein KY384_001319 [Bacidia gigantensis]